MYSLNNQLASGYGIDDMLDVCHKNKWTDENTILIVKNSNDLNSKWWILEKEKD